jgi:predicted NUDIX family phosphoesterase
MERSHLHNRSLYLRAAEHALAQMQRPATASEMAQFIKTDPAWSTSISGRTPDKTIQARIASDIKRYGVKSQFYRTGPATFALRQLAVEGAYTPNQKRVYVGFNRAQQIRNNAIATVDIRNLKFRLSSGFVSSNILSMRIIRNLPISYTNRRHIISPSHLCRIRLFLVVRYKDDVLSYSPSGYFEEDIKIRNHNTIGINGYFEIDDVDLFDASGIGIQNATRREFFEFFRHIVSNSLKVIDRINYIGGVYDSLSHHRGNEMGIVVECALKTRIDLESNKLGVKNLNWLSLRRIPNSFFHLEPWSQYVFKKLNEEYET